MFDFLFRLAIKLGINLVVWVLILSIEWNGELLFDRAHRIIMESPVSESVHESLQAGWDSIHEVFHRNYAKYHKPNDTSDTYVR